MTSFTIAPRAIPRSGDDSPETSLAPLSTLVFGGNLSWCYKGLRASCL